MGKAICFALASALVLAGCGSQTQASSLGVGGSGSSSSSAGVGGGAGTGGSESGTGGAGAPSCTIASISVDGDGPTNHFNAACMGAYGTSYTSHANGYLAYTSPTSSDIVLTIEGCADGMAPPMDGSLSLTIPETGVGSAVTGTASYANGVATFTTDTEVTAMITELTSATIQGSYTATVSSTSSGQKMLSGTFSVCRVPNYRPK